MSNWVLLGRLGLALALSSSIGVEREFRRKAAGLRTITLVGVGAALAMIVSKYGFGDMHGADMSLDASRVAAQIVSGIGFLGAGIIFVRRDTVAGLTTAERNKGNLTPKEFSQDELDRFIDDLPAKRPPADGKAPSKKNLNSSGNK